MKEKAFSYKQIFSGDRIKRFILSSLFCALITIVGCGNAVTMHKAQSVGSVSDSAEKVQKSLEDISKRETEESVAESVDAEEDVSSTIRIHICGEVNNPGVYEIEVGSRVIDAVELAGGFTDVACSDEINLAGVLSDSVRVYIPNEQDIKDGKLTGDVSANGAESTGKALININTADEAQLVQITGIGQTRARSIIEYRQKNGRFNRIEDIQKVSGIGEASFDKMKDMITVE